MKIFWFLESRRQSTAPDEPGDLNEDLRGSRWVMWITFLGIAIFVAWAWYAELDQITRAPGSVIASSRTQLVQSQDGGVLEEMFVREGDRVEAGQLLARIDRTRAQAAYLETRAKAAALSAALARLKGEMFTAQPRYDAAFDDYPEFRSSQNELLRKRRAALDEDLAAVRRMKALVEEELSLNLPLVQSGDVSRTEVLRLQRQVADLQAQMTNKRNKYFQDVQAEFGKTQEELAGVEQMMAQRRSQLDQTELRAPVRGVVKDVRITTQGGVIRPGEDVMQIVPLEDDLVIEARVSPADIAFLALGLDATVKIDAYDYTVYGGLPGKLTFVSADTLKDDLRQGEEPYYRVQVRTTAREFSKGTRAALEIQPGMTGSIEIKTGRKTVLQYLAKPIVKTLDESLGER